MSAVSLVNEFPLKNLLNPNYLKTCKSTAFLFAIMLNFD